MDQGAIFDTFFCGFYSLSFLGCSLCFQSYVFPSLDLLSSLDLFLLNDRVLRESLYDTGRATRPDLVLGDLFSAYLVDSIAVWRVWIMVCKCLVRFHMSAVKDIFNSGWYGNIATASRELLDWIIQMAQVSEDDCVL